MDHAQVWEKMPRKDYLIYSAAVLTAFLLFLLWRTILPPGIPVEKVTRNTEQYLGKTITIRGFARGIAYQTTLIDCAPFVCDCNDTTASYFLFGPEPVAKPNPVDRDQSLYVKALDCRGNDCTLVCDGFVHNRGEQYSFTGKLSDTLYGMSLVNVNLEKSKHKVGWFWVPVSQNGGKIDLPQ